MKLPVQVRLYGALGLFTLLIAVLVFLWTQGLDVPAAYVAGMCTAIFALVLDLLGSTTANRTGRDSLFSKRSEPPTRRVELTDEEIAAIEEKRREARRLARERQDTAAYRLAEGDPELRDDVVRIIEASPRRERSKGPPR